MAEAVVPGYDRDDKAYLAFLEDEFTRRKREDERKMKMEPSAPELADINRTLIAVTDRLANLETKITDSSHATSGGDPAASGLITDPLTKALAKLAGEDVESGRHLRPETYSQSDIKDKNRDSTKMDLVDLFYGWSCIASHLVSSGGDIDSYLRHVKFATEMIHTRKFYDCGAIKYDRLIIDKFLSGKSHRFDPDTIISSITFSANVIPEGVDLCHGASLTKGVLSYLPAKQTRRRRSGQLNPRRSEDVPADFPPRCVFLL